MVNNSPEALDRIFGALADPTRRAILERLAVGELTVSELAAPYVSSLPAISKHLRVLESAGLITRRAAGRHRYCRIVPEAMRSAGDWIDHYSRFWTAQLDALEEMLESDMEEDQK